MSDVAEPTAPSTRSKQSIGKMLVVWLILALVAAIVGMRLPRDPTVYPRVDDDPKAASTRSGLGIGGP